jgi:hypothetical protein
MLSRPAPQAAGTAAAASKRVSTPAAPDSPGNLPIRQAPAQLPVTFIGNQGQWNPATRFVAQDGALAARFENDGIQLQLGGARPASVGLTFEGASPSASVMGVGKQSGYYNFFLGNDPSGWVSHVATYGSILYQGLYPGVDVSVQEAAGHLEYNVLLRPGADLSQVVIHVDGAAGLALAPDGSLVVQTPAGPLRETAPVAWQVSPTGAKQPVAGGFRILDAQDFGFTAPGRDPSQPLVVDPGLNWSTFLGGNNIEEMGGMALANDGTNDVIVTGDTWSRNFPATSGSFPATAPLMAFVARLNSTGTTLEYATLFGSPNGDEYPHAIALAGGGAPIVVGDTDAPDYPTTQGAFQTTLQGSDDAFVTEFNATGSKLVFSTYLGGGVDTDPSSPFYQMGGGNQAWGVALDPSGSIIVSGNTSSPSFPTTAGAYDTTWNPFVIGTLSTGRTFSINDMFVARLSAKGTSLTYGTYLGGQGEDYVTGMVVDSQGFVTLSGYTAPLEEPNNIGVYVPQGNPFPTTAGAVVSTYQGGSDAVVARLQLNGAGTKDLIYSTMLGSNDNEEATSLALDPSNPQLVTLAGYTASWDFLTTPGAFERAPFSADDWTMAFVTQFQFPTSGGGSVAWSALVGGPGNQVADGVAMDGAENVYIAGTLSADFPTTDRSYYRLLNGESATAYFVAQLSPDGRQLPYATLIPGTDAQGVADVAIDGANTVVIAGNTSSPNFPTTPGAYQPAFGGLNDDFVSQLTLLPNTISDTTPGAPSLLSPADGATIAADAGGNFDVTVSWSTATTKSGVQAYELQVSPNPAFIINSINQNIWLDDVYTTGTQVSFSWAQPGNFYWRVRTLDNANLYSPWSPARSFIDGLPGPFLASALTLNQSAVVGGTTAQGTIILQGPAPSGGVSVALTSNNAVISVPSSVTVPAGATSASFTITTLAVSTSTAAQIQAQPGTNYTATLWVDPSPTAGPLSVTLSPTSVYGGTTSQGTVTLSSPAPSGGTVVTLSSSNTAVATVPTSVTVPAGSTSATFTASTSAVSFQTLVAITASSGGATESATLKVNPAPSPVTVASLVLNPTSVHGGNKSQGTVTLNEVAPSGGLVVTLTSSNTGVATVPASVTVPAGAQSATFTVSTNKVTNSTSVKISASAGGVTQTATLGVTRH